MISKDALPTILDAVIPYSSPIIHTLIDEPVRELGALLLSKLTSFREQMLLHKSYSFFTFCETWQISLADHHHLNKNYDLVSMFLKSHKASLEQFAELGELFRFFTTKNINELLSQLKWRFFKL